MDFRQLEYLKAAIEHGSYSAAARKLFVTPQAISKAIISLENETKRELMRRDGNSMQPTEYALEMLPKIEDLLSQFHALKDDFADKPNSSG